MTLGHVPMTRVLIEHLPDFRRDGAEVNASIRSKAQDIIRGKFLLTEDPLFKKQQDEDAAVGGVVPVEGRPNGVPETLGDFDPRSA